MSHLIGLLGHVFSKTFLHCVSLSLLIGHSPDEVDDMGMQLLVNVNVVENVETILDQVWIFCLSYQKIARRRRN